MLNIERSAISESLSFVFNCERLVKIIIDDKECKSFRITSLIQISNLSFP